MIHWWLEIKVLGMFTVFSFFLALKDEQAQEHERVLRSVRALLATYFVSLAVSLCDHGRTSHVD